MQEKDNEQIDPPLHRYISSAYACFGQEEDTLTLDIIKEQGIEHHDHFKEEREFIRQSEVVHKRMQGNKKTSSCLLFTIFFKTPANPLEFYLEFCLRKIRIKGVVCVSHPNSSSSG